MSDWSPPSLPTELLVAVVALWALFFGYMVLVQATVLLGLLPAVVLGVGYYLWRVLAALEAIATAVHRIADDRSGE